MNPKLPRTITAITISLMILGSFTNPAVANAGFLDNVLGTFGIGNGSNSSSNQNNNSDGTIGEHNGELELTKEARRVGRDQKYHDKIRVRSGELVEVRIEVKNRSGAEANAVVRDELGGSVVYVKNSLRVNGQASQDGLTSNGLQIKVPAKSISTIIYQFNVCGSSGYVTRASVYAPLLGSAVDGLLIEMENLDTNFYYDEVSTCLSQLQNSAVVSTNSNTASNSVSGWTSVNNVTNTNTTNSSNPFAGWTGVNNANSASSISNSSFGTWTGVNNASATTTASNNPFAGWTGVNNSDAFSNNSNEIFGTWTGVNNSTSTGNPFGDWASSNNNSSSTNYNGFDTFGTWTGVNNSDQTSNPFGDWTGVSGASQGATFDARGYTANTNSSVQEQSAGRPVAYTPTTTTVSSSSNFVAPTTGVNALAPFGFAALLTTAYLAFRHRKFLFN